jgi:hypothetical protein
MPNTPPSILLLCMSIKDFPYRCEQVGLHFFPLYLVYPHAYDVDTPSCPRRASCCVGDVHRYNEEHLITNISHILNRLTHSNHHAPRCFPHIPLNQGFNILFKAQDMNMIIKQKKKYFLRSEITDGDIV